MGRSLEDFKCNNLIVINMDYEAEESISCFGAAKRVKFILLWKWLLTDKKED